VRPQSEAVNCGVFTVERHGPWQVLLLTGELDLSVGSELQGDVIQLLPADEVRMVAIDLSEVTFIDSTAIGILAMAHKRAARAGGHLVLVAAPERVERVLYLTGLSTVLDIRSSLADLDLDGPPADGTGPVTPGPMS
jgi:anti-sigma B factor antagonist